MKKNIRKTITKTLIEHETLKATKKEFLFNNIELNITKGGTMPFLGGIVPPLCVFAEKAFHKHMRCGP